ncbi:MAG: hypothetical protein K0Q94_4328 [Paenibacillus sp.]|nr:hypothetical protein [Paenibacillus sp.]
MAAISNFGILKSWTCSYCRTSTSSFQASKSVDARLDVLYVAAGYRDSKRVSPPHFNTRSSLRSEVFLQDPFSVHSWGKTVASPSSSRIICIRPCGDQLMATQFGTE